MLIFTPSPSTWPTTMLALVPLLVVLILTLSTHLPTTQAKHYTCNWGGPGNDPYKGGYSLYCTGMKSDEDLYTARYICDFGGGYHTEVATYGMLGGNGGEYGIIEFETPCNSPGNFVLYAEDCKPSTWGLCIGERSKTTGDYNLCYYMQYYDDCEWPNVITNTEKPDKVTIFRRGYGPQDEYEKVGAAAGPQTAKRTDHSASVLPPAGIETARNAEDGEGVAGREEHYFPDGRESPSLGPQGSEVSELGGTGRSHEQADTVKDSTTEVPRTVTYGKDEAVSRKIRSTWYGKAEALEAVEAGKGGADVEEVL